MTFLPPNPLYAPLVDAFWQAGDADFTAAFNRAIAAGYTRLKGRAGSTYVLNGVVLNSCQFDGGGCVVQDAVGAPYSFRLSGHKPGLWDVEFQDQGNVAFKTANVGGFAQGATAITVANATGFAVGQMILLQEGATLWETTQVDGVAGNVITLHQPTTAAAAAGLSVVGSFGLINLIDSDSAIIDNMTFNNTNVGLVVASSSDAASVGLARISRLKMQGSRYAAAAFYRSVYDCDFSKSNLYGGVVDHYSYIGAGVAGAFDAVYSISLISNITVYVGGVSPANLKTYGVDYSFADAHTITFLPGHYPAIGAAIDIYNYHAGVRALVHDSRGGGSLVPAGNTFESLRCEGALVGVDLVAVQANSYVEIIADTNMLTGVQLTNVSAQNEFIDLWATFTRTAVSLINSANIELIGMTTTLIPPGQFNPFLPTNAEISVDATSSVDVDVAAWNSSAYTTTGAGDVVFYGGQKTTFASATTMAGGASAYLGPAGQVSVNLPCEYVEKNSFVVAFEAKVNTAPGVGQSIAFNLISNANTGSPTTLATVTISGTNLTATLAAPVACGKRTWLSVQAVYSAGAASSYPLGYFMRR